MTGPRRALVLAAAVGLALPSGATALASASEPAEPDRVEVPVLGTFVVDDVRGQEVQGAVHGVRRVDGATAVYYSLGVPEGEALSAATALPLTTSRDRYRPTDAWAVGVVDTAGLALHETLTGPAGCLCPQSFEIGTAGGVMHVGWALVPPLPASVATVGVRVGDALVEDVPVQDGPLLPAVDEPSTVLGQAWPALPDAGSVPDPDAFVRALVRNESDLERTVVVQERAGRVDESLAADVLFAVDSATLTPQAQQTLAELAVRLRERATGEVRVVGHTDATGDDAYNQDLSVRRARAVADALRSQAGDLVLAPQGRGEAEPVADDATAEGRARNRRVTVTYTTTPSG